MALTPTLPTLTRYACWCIRAVSTSILFQPRGMKELSWSAKLSSPRKIIRVRLKMGSWVGLWKGTMEMLLNLSQLKILLLLVLWSNFKDMQLTCIFLLAKIGSSLVQEIFQVSCPSLRLTSSSTWTTSRLTNTLFSTLLTRALKKMSSWSKNLTISFSTLRLKIKKSTSFWKVKLLLFRSGNGCFWYIQVQQSQAPWENW